ncbi:enoyl-CoA hydratase/isomerase family protein [Actinomycetospora endophytica]|uniref:Enoyl-CoA hydratase/isomerase family protein n=1 Tax=Actinomycetospora endophytica TaxID=2291215 RepID=A0ABS8PDQ9_9PSEU|nr:enoyl-CoA hydratase/isomerase family protein [Actinomycetospora endophytica]MCD2196042.1 enoyl-CoA hydratase/isomerase family protein [Actinomycetospora endophytica]
MSDVVVHREGDVVHLTIDRPAAKNALSPSVVEGLEAALDDAEDARVVVLRGRGGTLSAGADLHHVRRLLADGDGLEAYLVAIGAVCDRLESGPFVSVAVVDGYALAGGCELLLACDLAVAADDARIGDRHLEFGLLPGAGGSVRLPRALPPPLARRLLYTGEMIDGATAGAWGLVSHTAAPDELEGTVEALVARLARHGPDALRGMKRMYRAAAPAPAPELFAAERAALVEHLTTSSTVADGLGAFARRSETRPTTAQEAP